MSARVPAGARVEEEPRVGDLVGGHGLPRGAERGARRPVQGDHVLQIAHAHMVGGHGQVVAAELTAGVGQVAGGSGERPTGIEALVHPSPFALEARQPARGARASAKQLGQHGARLQGLDRAGQLAASS